MPFSKNQVTDQSSDLSDTADHCLKLQRNVLCLVCQNLIVVTDRIQNFVDIFCQ